jgi:hypothetical protein
LQRAYGDLHEPGANGWEANELVVVIVGRELAQTFRVVASVEGEELFAVVGKREDVDLVV